MQSLLRDNTERAQYMKISMGSWAFSFGPYADLPIPLSQVATRLAAAGYDGIELGGFFPHLTLDRYPDSASRAELRRFLSDLGLGVSGYTADFTEVNPTAAGKKERYIDLFRRQLEVARDVGSPTLRVDSGAAPGSLSERDYQDAFSRLAETWNACAQYAQADGIKMVWEFEPAFIFNKPSEILALHQRVNHPAFKILFDTAHAYMASVAGARQQGQKETLPGGISELLKMLDGRIGGIHLVDSDGTLYGDETSTHLPLGEGVVPFRSLIPQLLELPEVDWWCTDLSFWPSAWDMVESSLASVRDMIRAAGSKRVR